MSNTGGTITTASTFASALTSEKVNSRGAPSMGRVYEYSTLSGLVTSTASSPLISTESPSQRDQGIERTPRSPDAKSASARTVWPSSRTTATMESSSIGTSHGSPPHPANAQRDMHLPNHAE